MSPLISRGFGGRRRRDVDPTRIPPGQYVVDDFPVLSAGPTPTVSLDQWTFSITGAGNTIQSPWGSWPGYLSMIDQDFDRARESAVLVGAAYDFNALVTGLSANTNLVWGWNAINPSTRRKAPDRAEYDFTVDYRPPFPVPVLQGMWFRARAAILDQQDAKTLGYQFRITETDGGEIPLSAQFPETTVLVPVGSTRTIEFTAAEPGDWAMHCHMTHHVMNQMGHGVPNLIGVEPGKLDERVRKVIPGYMTMGQTGMGEMGDMGMKVPANSIPMLGGQGKHDAITMGGMFTILKTRNGLRGYRDPGWYDAPAATIATGARAADLRRDGIDPDRPPPIEEQAEE